MSRFAHPCRRAALVVSCLVVGACAGGESAAIDGPAAGALRGELVVYTLTFDDGTTDERFALRVGAGVDREADGEEHPLFFARPPEVPPGTRLDVWGTSTAEGLVVSRHEPVRGPGGVLETQVQPLIAGAPLRARSFAFVLVDIGAGVNITAEEAQKRLFGTVPGPTPSVRQYFMEASYGRQDVSGQVFGPFKHTMSGCDTRAMTTALRPMIPGTFDHYLWYLGSRIPSCGWSGLASGGTTARPARDTWYNASAGCVVLVQEPGHNFGMRHSSAMKCPGASFVDAPEDVCMHSEYGDTFDPMGRGCRHMNGAQKAYLGWYGKCNVVEIFSSGSYTLLPTELPCDGTQVLQVPMPKARPFFRQGGGGSAGVTELTHYYLELRAPHGIDKGLAPQVQIRVSADTRQANQRAAHTWFIDTNPATPALDGLGAGGTFSDPTGAVKFTIEAVSDKQATVKVEVTGGPGGAPKCLDGTTLTGAGPGPESCAAAPFSVSGAPPPAPAGDAAAPPPIDDPGPRDGGSRDTGRGSGGISGSGGPTDAAVATGGAPGNRGGTPGTAGTGGSAAAPATPPPLDGGGCGCRVGDGPAPPAAVTFAGLLLALLTVRRRRR